MTALLLITLKSHVNSETLYLEQVEDTIIVNNNKYTHYLWINSKSSTIFDSALYTIFETASKNDIIKINRTTYYVHEITNLISRYE
ncbi:hypothetical protein [Acinetobacter nectaris]|uniref:hypothetical protein n=1 Tax=Acinetobacter nectaris TaxID=1219382 RepID=UPI001F313ED2|nr:hypothetical protein [Acinetobacter nectaris]MCF8998870.1 hypothetical protein [Acinetobacter nectaris]MCF9027889.1 hypothetical protein [Acinetobacter nectaris]